MNSNYGQLEEYLRSNANSPCAMPGPHISNLERYYTRRLHYLGLESKATFSHVLVSDEQGEQKGIFSFAGIGTLPKLVRIMPRKKYGGHSYKQSALNAFHYVQERFSLPALIGILISYELYYPQGRPDCYKLRERRWRFTPNKREQFNIMPQPFYIPLH